MDAGGPHAMDGAGRPQLARPVLALRCSLMPHLIPPLVSRQPLSLGRSRAFRLPGDCARGRATVAAPKRPRVKTVRRVARTALLAIVSLVFFSIALVALYGPVDPPVTPLMLIRLVEGEGLRKDWVDYGEISPELVRAVLSAEDTRFCRHFGIDWQAVRAAWDRNRRGGRVYGGSTITMQTAKNLFLWPDRHWIRKGFELWFALLLESVLDKRRIVELYLNVVEWGGGIYGAEAASRAYFGKAAAALSRREAALMAAVLPNPRRWSPARPTGYIIARAANLEARMRILPDDVARLCRS